MVWRSKVRHPQCAWEQSRELRVISIAQVIAGAVQRFGHGSFGELY
jgi:hypothetical protein